MRGYLIKDALLSVLFRHLLKLYVIIRESVVLILIAEMNSKLIQKLRIEMIRSKKARIVKYDGLDNEESREPAFPKQIL